jgi:tetratricopeptide (TPR) repeat protein
MDERVFSMSTRFRAKDTKALKLFRALVAGGALLLTVCTAGCALPAPEVEEQQFVTPKEITIVSLTREGLEYAKRSRLVDAELKLRQAYFLAPDQFTIALNLAVVLDRQGLYGEARALYRELRKQKPRSVKLLSALAHVYVNQYEFGEAERLYIEALTIALDENLGTEIVQVSRSLSVLNFLRGDEEAAICWSQFVLQFSKEPAQIYRHARLLLALDRGKEVIELLKGSSNFAADDARLGIVLAEALIETGDQEQALSLVKLLNSRTDLPVNLSFELSLLKVLVFTEPEFVGADQQEEFEEKKEELFSILDSDPLQNQVSIYWPGEMIKRLEELFTEREEELASREKSILWFSPDSEPVEQPL